MRAKRFLFVTLLSLPGLAFWLHIPFWQWIWPIIWGPGENWLPLIIQLGLAWLSLIFAVFNVVAGVVALVRKRDGIVWWTAAMVNGSPLLFAGYFYS